MVLQVIHTRRIPGDLGAIGFGVQRKRELSKIAASEGEGPMRLIHCSVAISFAFLAVAFVAVAASAQQPPPTAGETIGHPPPLPGPPPLSEPGKTSEPGKPQSQQPTPDKAKPAADQPNAKGYTGAYTPAGTPPTPYSTGPLQKSDSGPGLDVAAPDGATRTVKAVPCGVAAHETDGFTTCVGISEQHERQRRRR